MRIKRVVFIVLDGLGIGAAADAAAYGDAGANTLKSVVEKGKPNIPNLTDLGLLNAAGLSGAIEDPLGCFGAMAEKGRREGHHQRPLGDGGADAEKSRSRPSPKAFRPN